MLLKDLVKEFEFDCKVSMRKPPARIANGFAAIIQKSTVAIKSKKL